MYGGSSLLLYHYHHFISEISSLSSLSLSSLSLFFNPHLCNLHHDLCGSITIRMHLLGCSIVAAHFGQLRYLRCNQVPAHGTNLSKSSSSNFAYLIEKWMINIFFFFFIINVCIYSPQISILYSYVSFK